MKLRQWLAPGTGVGFAVAVIWVYLQNHTLDFTGILLAVLAVLLLGWSSLSKLTTVIHPVQGLKVEVKTKVADKIQEDEK